MTDQERVLKLLEEGKITKEQAEGLLGALDEAEALELRGRELRESNDAVVIADATALDKAKVEVLDGFVRAVQPVSSLPPIPPSPPVPSLSFVPPVPPSVSTTEEERKTEPGQSSRGNGTENVEDVQWIHVQVLSGDVNISVNPSLQSPSLQSPRADTDGGLHLQQDKEGHWTINVKNDDLELEIPEGFGVLLNVQSGDVQAEVPVLKGSITSGDVSLENVASLDLSVQSGEVDGTLLLTKGSHQLAVTSGDVSLELLKGSDVALKGRVTSGDISLSSPQGELNRENGSFQCRVASGAASFVISVQSGDVDITSDDPTTLMSSANAKGVEVDINLDLSDIRKTVQSLFKRKRPPNETQR
ncbi:MAG: DUF4097 family beta strand repeat-containing protein [Trueperaceae bacterium]